MNSWDRQPNEPALWYDRLQIFRLLGPGRTLDAVYRIVSGKKGRAGGAYTANARIWRWVQRSEDWDAAGWQAQSAEEELRRREARERRLLIIGEARESAVEALRNANLRNISPDTALEIISQIRLLLRDTLTMERREIGESDELQEQQVELGTPADVEAMIAKTWGADDDDV